jgi:PAS domain S-box-containing protein/putative nucleotidyltransferase with HDIG domain
MHQEIHSIEPRDLYELAWTDAPGAMFAFDTNTGVLVSVNPAAESLSGYSREELLGSNIDLMHPEAERERVRGEFLHSEKMPSRHAGYHIRHKDGRSLPVMISSSKSLVLDGRHVAIGVYFDVSELKENEHHLATTRWALSAYAGAAMALWQKHTSESLLEAICEAITSESVYVLAWVGIAEDVPGKPVRVRAVAGNAQEYTEGLSFSWSEDDPTGQGPTGICIRTGQLQIVEDTETSAIYALWRERARQFGVRSCVSIPFANNGSLRGVLQVYSAQPYAFESSAIQVFQHLAEQMGHGMHAIERERLLHDEQKRLARTERQLTEALSAMVAPIVTAMEMRDPYTAGHQMRVADIACAIAKEKGWSDARLQGLRVASMVHDIGKISISAELLTKPTRLTPADWEIIHEHPETGYRILKDIPFPWPIAEIVRQHHERLDGSGYPFGLKGDAILPEAKILAVADVAEAMATSRPYRPAIKLETVLRELECQAGTRLDAEDVRVCVALFRENKFVLPKCLRAESLQTPDETPNQAALNHRTFAESLPQFEECGQY